MGCGMVSHQPSLACVPLWFVGQEARQNLRSKARDRRVINDGKMVLIKIGVRDGFFGEVSCK